MKEVDVSGPAKGKLRVGDWIRSVNGTPIQRPEEVKLTTSRDCFVIVLFVSKMFKRVFKLEHAMISHSL